MSGINPVGQSTDDPERWRALTSEARNMALEMADPEAKRVAEEARLEASQATDPEVKAVLLQIARACERLAQIVAKPQRLGGGIPLS